MKIVLDIMGADNPPEEILKGGLMYSEKTGGEVVIAGDKKYNTVELRKNPLISFLETEEVVGMDESPVEAVKAKKNSSLVKGLSLLKNGSAEAFVSPANSGAIMAGALFTLGRLTGISRPAIAVIIPTEKLPVLLIDGGANLDCKPLHVVHFAVMGSVYYKNIFGVENPKVGLLSVGTEESKGSEVVLEAFSVLKKSKLNFIGNVEGTDLQPGEVHVVACDGFVGNVVLKVTEGVASFMMSFLKKSIKSHIIRKIGFFLFLRGVVRDIKKKIDYDEYGGAPLLGVDGNVLICHGKSSAKAICNALILAAKLVDRKICDRIKEGLPVLISE